MLLVCLGACGAAPETPVSAVGPRVQDLLDTRAAALNDRDPGRYLAPVDPGAREFEQRLAEGAAAVPVGGFAFRISPDSLGPGGFPLDGVRAALDYHYEGLPEDNRFTISMLYRIELAGSEPVITRAEPAGGVPVWAMGPVAVEQSEHFVVLAPAGTEVPDDILQVAERARAEVAAAVPFEVDDRFLVVLAAGDADYLRLLGGASPLAGPRVAQAQTSFEATPEALRIEARHVLVNLQSLARERTGPATFKHELGHLALARVTTPITPGWVAESAAMYLAGQRTNWTQRVATGGFEHLSFAELSRTRELGETDPTGREAALQYSYAAGAAGYLVERFGAGRFWEFYRSYAEVPAADLYRALADRTPGNRAPGDLAAATTSRSLQEIFGMTEAELDTAVRDWIAANP